MHVALGYLEHAEEVCRAGSLVVIVVVGHAMLDERRELLQRAQLVGEVNRRVTLHGSVLEVGRHFLAFHEAVVEGIELSSLVYVSEHPRQLRVGIAFRGGATHVLVGGSLVAPYHGVHLHGGTILQVEATAIVCRVIGNGARDDVGASVFRYVGVVSVYAATVIGSVIQYGRAAYGRARQQVESTSLNGGVTLHDAVSYMCATWHYRATSTSGGIACASHGSGRAIYKP